MPDDSQRSERWSATLTPSYLRREIRAGRTPREIAQRVGCSENTVRDHLASEGLLDVGGSPRGVARDYQRLGTIAAVAAKHDVSYSTARRWLLAAGVALNDAHRPETADLNVESAARRYRSGESLADIARDFHVGVNTLKRRLEAHGVAMRSRGPRPSSH
jgi:transposase-like protein